MIGKISGRLVYTASDHVLIDTGGVGYLVYCSDRTLSRMPKPGGTVALYTELLVREDLLQLFGFPTMIEREWHRLLTSVQGVGARVGLAILGRLGPEGLGRALALGDVAAIKAAPGVGPKLATRIVSELKDKAPAIMALGSGGAQPAMVSGTPETPPAPEPAPSAAQPEAAQMAEARPTPAVSQADASADALSALVNLGYGMGDAAGAVARAAAEAPDAGTAALIRAALKLLAPKG
ncbi:Holliday junction branch migration protein RuvA [Oceanicella sp. SM1341]|uniref:Holliday junction branch migration protein RuvA n=1 Tax=Oceanicella sp. SM1341 TaxID=1548889 RepID=UPI000E47B176|nr:Holliday junction branch migration protein RuvA [Oceanicella sp. SM1341]